MKTLRIIFVLSGWLSCASASAQEIASSYYATHDVKLTANPQSSFWREVKPLVMERDRYGKSVAGHRTEIRARWTNRNLYFLFVCPYDALYLKPNPTTKVETNDLWDWDVAEIFIGADFDNIKRYREFEVSPLGQWVDLNIDLSAEPKVIDERWNSGFTSRARLDQQRKVWFVEFCLPLTSITSRAAKVGDEFRINFYRIQGPPPAARYYLAWQPVNNDSYHTPEAFWRLRLEK